MKRYVAITSVSAFAMMAVLSSCVGKNSMQQEEKASSPPQQEKEQIKEQQPVEKEIKTKKKTPQDPYDVVPEPLTVSECGQCHYQIFNQVKEDGGKHRFNCLNCHEQLHSYNPNRENWSEIMPKCSSCHIFPHGEQFSSCLDCHQNPHTPLNVTTAGISSECGNCHQGPQKELKDYPSMHTQLECSSCHYTHGEIPSCMDCHQPHVPDQELAACKSCHPVHKPLEVAYEASPEWNKTCSTCHDQVYAIWSATRSKHDQVDCGQCHTSHGYIPECQMCHGSPHSKDMLKKFPSCLECHIDPHDPPVKD
ncbi:MAG: cytochrome C [Thermodesulfobacteriota bacterium]